MKAAELKEFSNEDLVARVEELKEELFNLRFQSTRQQLANPKRIKYLKKTIARIYTILSERAAAANAAS